MAVIRRLPKYHRYLKDLLNEEEYGLKTLIKDDSVFILAFEKLMKLIEYKEGRIFGIPKIMFPYLNLYLLQALIYLNLKIYGIKMKKR